MQARRDWQEIFEVMKSRDQKPRFLYPAKLSFRNEGQIKSFPDKKKLKKYIITKPLLLYFVMYVLQCIIHTHVFMHIIHGIIIPMYNIIIIPMYNAHPYFSLKNFRKKVCNIHGKIWYIIWYRNLFRKKIKIMNNKMLINTCLLRIKSKKQTK